MVDALVEAIKTTPNGSARSMAPSAMVTTASTCARASCWSGTRSMGTFGLAVGLELVGDTLMTRIGARWVPSTAASSVRWARPVPLSRASTLRCSPRCSRPGERASRTSARPDRGQDPARYPGARDRGGACRRGSGCVAHRGARRDDGGGRGPGRTRRSTSSLESAAPVGWVSAREAYSMPVPPRAGCCWARWRRR